jgi:hypothetical protein
MPPIFALQKKMGLLKQALVPRRPPSMAGGGLLMGQKIFEIIG